MPAKSETQVDYEIPDWALEAIKPRLINTIRLAIIDYVNSNPEEKLLIDADKAADVIAVHVAKWSSKKAIVNHLDGS